MNRANRSTNKQHAEQEAQSPSMELGQLRRFNELMLRFLPIGVVIIDRSYRVLTANSSARRLLGLRETATDQDFLHAVRGIPYNDTRSAIDSVFRERTMLALPEVELEAASGGNGRFVNLSLALMQLEPGLPDLAAISVIDVNEQVQVRRQLESVQAKQTQLMQELGTANKRLSDMNKELMDANEELQVANEELVLTHEELQASIEEFETTNEELQATNEELETNNEELQATNEELETTNEELRARTSELQELTSILENERTRLAEIMELAPFYILVLRGPSLVVEAYNPRHARLLEEREVLGHPLENVIDLFWERRAGQTLIHLAREVYRQEVAQTTPRIQTFSPAVQGTEESQQQGYYSYTIVPSHDASGRVDGVIVYTTDETALQAREDADELEKLQTIFHHAKAAALALYGVQTGRLLIASPRYLELVSRAHNRAYDDIVGHSWQEISLLMPVEQAMQYWKTVIETRSAVHISEVAFPLLQGDHQETIWEYDLIPIIVNEEPKSVRYMLASAVEVSVQVRARKELERLDQLRDAFLALATHELRSPLTTIQGHMQLIQRFLKEYVAALDEKHSHKRQFDQSLSQIERVLRQTRHMNNLIETLLDVAHLQTEEFALHMQDHIDIVAWAKRQIEQYAIQDHHPIIFHSERESIEVTMDEGRIEQVLNNMLTNAMKYSPQGTPVAVTVTYQQDTAEAIVSVQDQGDGISDEDQAHLFERFYRGESTGEQESPDGLGLGLYIAYGIVRRHGGRMWVSSQHGNGSTFSFSLPLHR